jgi:DNA-binding transcriptional LysR family regulator
MELYQLRTFLAVANEGHLTRAAEKLFTSQPAVSAQIKGLEDELDVKLFDRSPRGMTLTSAGERLREQAQRVVEATRDFKTQADSLRGTVSGELVVGLNNRPDVLRLMPILQRLGAEYPALRYEMIAGSSGVILQGIEDGTVGIGFFEGECTSPRIAHHQLTTLELCLAAPIAWAEELSVPDWKLLESKPWIFVSPRCSYFRALEHICREQGLSLTPRYRVNEDLTVLNYVADGLGVTMVARGQIAASGLEGKVVALPHFRATVPLSIGYQAARADDPAIAAVRAAAIEVWQTPGHAEVKISNSEAKLPSGRSRVGMPPSKARRK